MHRVTRRSWRVGRGARAGRRASIPLLVHSNSESWELPVPLTLILALSAFVYWRGLLRIRSSPSNGVPAWRAPGFLLGLILVWVAVGSPLASCDAGSLTAHMMQHLLLMTFAPPLILLGAPVMTLEQGLPRLLGPGPFSRLLQRRYVRRVGEALSEPVVCWTAATATLVGWHVPALFALALRSHTWHAVEHASFFVTGLLFWWPVIRPWPSASSNPRWSMVLYLFFATLPCDILAGFLVFSDRVAYSVYLSDPGRSTLTVLQDQQSAGALMWTCVTIVYLVAGTILSTRLLVARETSGAGGPSAGEVSGIGSRPQRGVSRVEVAPR